MTALGCRLNGVELRAGADLGGDAPLSSARTRLLQAPGFSPIFASTVRTRSGVKELGDEIERSRRIASTAVAMLA